MKIRDIIDLEYLLALDEKLESDAGIQHLAVRDRQIFNTLALGSHSDKNLLAAWLKERSARYEPHDSEDRGHLPGALYFSLFRMLAWGLAISGGLFGAGIAYSFLAYHGVAPVNVTLFGAVFICLPFLLALVSLGFAGANILDAEGKRGAGGSGVFRRLFAAILFKGLPGILRKINRPLFDRGNALMQQTAFLVNLSSGRHRRLFFWPFFRAGSIFAVCFSTGVLAAVLFRVLVTDLAFGWQSTILSSSRVVHHIVSVMARPWSGWIPAGYAFPDLAQIEGSRIILKDGISMLATQDLVSWWPFVCLSVLFYAILPRIILVAAGAAGQRHSLKHYDLFSPAVLRLLARMKHGLLSVHPDVIPGEGIRAPHQDNRTHRENFSQNQKPDSRETLVMAGRTAYPKEILDKVIGRLETRRQIRVKKTLAVDMDLQHDLGLLEGLDFSGIDQVLFIQEVWQPPIRGLLHYLKQIRAALPDVVKMCIVLTRDTGEGDLTVIPDDPDLDIWQKAVSRPDLIDICIERFVF